MGFSSFEFFNSDILRSTAYYANLYWLNLVFEYLPTYLFFTYGLLIFIIPRVLKKQYVLSAGLLIGLGALTLLVQKLVAEIDIYYVQPLVFDFTAETPFTWSDIWDDLGNRATWSTFSFDFLLVGFCAVGIKLFNARMKKQADNEQLEQETLQAELKLIKTQINAEFLFNTLSDLYQLTSQKSPEAPGMVLRLANLMSYLLYESQADEVPLEREVEMIQDYVFLAKTYYKNAVDIALTVSGDVTDKLIAPLLLLPLLENAFTDTREIDQSWVTIQLSVTGKLLKVNILKGMSQRVAVRFEPVEKRLHHLYPNRYEFTIIPEEDVLIIKLDLVLNESSPAQNPPDPETTLLIGR